MRPLIRFTYVVFRALFALYGILWAAITVVALLVIVSFNDLDAIDLALNCDDPCVIKDNPGGSVYLFQLAADSVLSGKRKKVIIDGSCASACAFFAEKARPRVCITPNAKLGYHKGIVGDDERLRFVLEHAPDINDWVMRNGGWPKEGMLWMSFSEAKRFWPVCTG